ncbi:DUF1461 domain-containing protein [Nanoarchaeota archaeon]
MEKTIVIGTVSLAFFILITGFYIPYYNHGLFFENFIENEVMIKNTGEIYADFRDYMDKGIFNYKRTELISDFTNDEQSHITDVKKIIDWLRVLYYAAVVLIVTSLILMLMEEDPVRSLAKTLMYGGISSLFVIVVFGTFAFISFDTFWIFLHKILFDGNWMFAPTNLLLILFPETFQREIAIRVIMMISILSAISAGIGLVLNHQTKSSSS